MATPSMEQMMRELQDPKIQELAERHGNARIAVSEAYRLATEAISRITPFPSGVRTSEMIIALARTLAPAIECDLNATIDKLSNKEEHAPKLS